jgi:GMP synthase-like glutamine amidotransferase
MEIESNEPVRIALLDLYNGKVNQGIRSLRALISASEEHHGRRVVLDAFDVRQHAETPDLSYDMYVSSGGPGSPHDGEGTAWEAAYFDWLGALWQHNAEARPSDKKHVLFICHSFQMMCRYFELGAVTQRHAESFGIVPVHRTEAGWREPLFTGLADPFWAADFRRWQVVQPNRSRFQELGATIIALEQQHLLPHERALMGIRLSPEMVGVQFHPEANPEGMLVHFQQTKRRDDIVGKFGEERYERLIRRLGDPTYLAPTHRAIVPTFLERAVRATRPAPVPASQPASS